MRDGALQLGTRRRGTLLGWLGRAAAGDGDVEPAVAGALLGDVDVDVLGLGVGEISLLAELAADAGLLVAAEGVPGG